MRVPLPVSGYNTQLPSTSFLLILDIFIRSRLNLTIHVVCIVAPHSIPGIAAFATISSTFPNTLHSQLHRLSRSLYFPRTVCRHCRLHEIGRIFLITAHFSHIAIAAIVCQRTMPPQYHGRRHLSLSPEQ